MELPGYRFDAVQNRYFKLDPLFDKPAAPKPPSPQSVGIKKKPKLFQYPPQVSHGAIREGVMLRGFQNMHCTPIPTPRALQQLICAGEYIAATHGNQLFAIKHEDLVNDHWKRLELYPSPPASSSVSYLESSNAALLATFGGNRMLHYSPLAQEQLQCIDLNDDDMRVSHHALPIQGGVEMLCLTSNNIDTSLLLGKGVCGVLIKDDGEPRPIKFPGKRIRSDPLCAQFSTTTTQVLVGLRQGSILQWDMRERAAAKPQFQVSTGPVTKLWQHPTCEHLVTCFSPNGNVCEPSMHLVDLRFEKRLASYDLHCGSVNAPAPMVCQEFDQHLILGLDARVNQYRLFNMDNAQFVYQLSMEEEEALPSGICSNAYLPPPSSSARDHKTRILLATTRRSELMLVH